MEPTSSESSTPSNTPNPTSWAKTNLSQNPVLSATPRFQLGQRVYWAKVPSRDFGQVVGMMQGAGPSCTIWGYHYLVHLDPRSPSYAECQRDWAYEGDLQLLDGNIPPAPLSQE